jgi:hypothetical protein
MSGYLFVVTCRNVALGIFATMDDAKRSISLTHQDSTGPTMTRTGPSGCFASVQQTNGNETFDYSIVAVKPSDKAGKLFS